MAKISFRKVSEILEKIEQTPSRNEITEILADFYKQLETEDAEILSYLILGRIAPPFVAMEFNYSEKSLVNLLSSYTKVNNLNIDIATTKEETGDIGETVVQFVTESKFKSTNKTLLETYELLWQIMNITGTGSVDRKNALVLETLKTFSPLEAKYFVRVICGELRFGVNAKTLLDVFSFVVSGDKSLREELDRAYGVRTDIGYICSQIMNSTQEEVMSKLQSLSLLPGVPVLVRLVERVGSFDEVFERFEMPILVQPKFDGLRCQIHKYQEKDDPTKDIDVIWEKYLPKEEKGLFATESNGTVVKLFTRNLEDVTEMFPEIVESAKKMKYDSFVLDSEALGYRDGRFLPFQETMQRRRKYDVSAVQQDIPVKAMCFDVLFLNGGDLSQKDTSERIDVLEDLGMQGEVDRCLTESVNDMKGLQRVFDKNIENGNEGVIVKSGIGQYLPGVRNYEWIKLKKSMINALVDTVDLVCVGYYRGSGRRSKLGVGAVLGALYNAETDMYEAICKVGTGFTDELLEKIKEQLDNMDAEEKPQNILCPDSLTPDVWVYPEIVFTVEADEITKRLSGEDIGGGLSLRFPRLIEWNRDKSANDATTVKELKGMYKMKKQV